MKLATLLLTMAAMAVVQIGTTDVASAAKAKFERTKPHMNIGTIQPSSIPAPHVAPRGPNQPVAGPKLTPQNLSEPGGAPLLPVPSPDSHRR